MNNYRIIERVYDSDCTGVFSFMGYTSFIFGILFLSFTTLLTTGKVNVLLIDQYAPFVFKINTKYLSIGLDSSVIARNFKNFNMSDPKLVKIIGHLSPAYLRVGGNMADCLVFQSNSNMSLEKNIGKRIDGGDCSYSNDYCQYQVLSNFTMNGIEWLNLNNLTRNAKLDMIFDLNVLRRFPNNSWNPENAKQLIDFSNHNLDISWQLGNEPNAFRHQFNHTVNATQLAMDFQVLKKLLNKYHRYEKSLLIGPETTRPQAEKKDSITYMTEFLKNSGNIIDIISWHQYYFNGRTASALDFLDPKIFDILTWQIDTIMEIRKRSKLSTKRVWLTETSSAWGGGSPLYSDRFIGTFIWLDKLGLAAKKGIDVVVRQSIFSGYYALIGNDYMPNPDYWVSILFKQLVGKEVISCYNVASQKVRLYCHCTNTGSNRPTFSSVTVFGMNMQDVPAKVRIEGMEPLFPYSNTRLKVLSYTLTSKGGLDTKEVYLNDRILKLTKDNEIPIVKPNVVDAKPFLIMPPFSIVFWVVPTKLKICDKY